MDANANANLFIIYSAYSINLSILSILLSNQTLLSLSSSLAIYRHCPILWSHRRKKSAFQTAAQQHSAQPQSMQL